MRFEDLQGHWALVTGASSGIGREFCVQLAAGGVNVVLVARREEALHELARQLGAAPFGVRTLVVPMDLSIAGTASKIHEATAQSGIRIRLLINNAGFGHWGPFEAASPDIYERMVAVNAGAAAALCREFFVDLTSYTTSAVINVSSPAAYQAVPYMAAYAATKAFVLSFSQALYGEWGQRGILVQALVPGPTATEFDQRAGAYGDTLGPRGRAADVVKGALRQLSAGVPVAVTARGTLKQRVLAGILPPRFLIREVAKLFRPPS